MLTSILVSAAGSENLSLRFKTGPDYLVEISERSAVHLPPAEVETLIEACQAIARSCLNGETLDYGLFSPDGKAWSRTVVTLVRRRTDGKPIAFNAMPLLPVVRAGQQEHVLHLGLVMVDPNERGEGLSWILYGLTCFVLFIRGGMRPLWISSVTQVPAVVGMVAETFANVYPAQHGTKQTFDHRHMAHQIMAHEREAFGVGEEAGFDPETQVISNAYTGGSNNLKKTYAIAAKHRNERYNAFCAQALNYERGDDILQIGRIDLTTARRYLMRAVPRWALPGLLAQSLFVACNAVIAPTLQWLNSSKQFGLLRPR